MTARILLAAALIFADAVIGPPVAAETAQRAMCNSLNFSPDQRIRACTGLMTLEPKNVNWVINRGNAYSAKREFDLAIADYDKAIELCREARCSETGWKYAYSNRASAWKAKGELDRAIADYDQALRHDPKDVFAYSHRASALMAKGELDRAIIDYDQAIRLDPKNSSVYLSRGRAHLYSGALTNALADFNQASELNPNDAYVALWLDFLNKRGNLPSRLAEAAKQIDMTKWPAPIIRLYLGQLTPAAMLAAADDPNANTKKGHVCEANFYRGELALAQNNKDDARRLFEVAAAGCPKDFVEYEGASAELKMLPARH